ncbi:LpqB family beta-propeller domain-containing protein [Salinibacter ruber]|nr:LpqB family beta-propeller domain-containing protein [Salinibacter ruber]
MDGGDNGDGSGGNGTTLSAPSGLSGSAGDGTVDLGWDAVSAEDLGGYNVYRSTSSISDISGKSPLNESLLPGTSYTDDGVENGTTYYYVVSAVDTSGNESGSSSEVTASPSDMTAPAAPSGFSGSAGDGTVDLGWDGVSAEDLGGYNVYRSTSSISDISGRSPLNESLLSGTSYTDDGVENGTTYYYVVSAVDTSGNESDPSSEVTASPSGSGGGGSANNLIAFSSEDTGGDAEIYTVRPDGSNLRQVTNSATGISPTWSPDGSRIAFTADGGGDDANDPIATIRPDGSDLSPVTDPADVEDGRIADVAPEWSPSGDRIAFSRDPDTTARDTTEPRIYTVDPDGSDLRQVAEDKAIGFNPTWSPDGSRIAFSTPADPSVIFTIRPDGSDLRQVTDRSDIDGNSGDLAPAWSPDGSRIAFQSDRDGGSSFDIYTVDPDGSDLKQVTTAGDRDDRVDDISPAWSPDGSRIVFGSNRDGSAVPDIYTIRPDGSELERITNNDRLDFGPAWSPSQ